MTLAREGHLKEILDLRLDSNAIGDPEAILLAKARFSVSNLSLAKNRLGDAGSEVIASKWAADLKGLDLSDNSMSEKGVTSFSSRFGPKLRKLRLQGLISIDLRGLVERLPAGLTELDLGNNSFSLQEFQILGSRLPQGLKILNLSRTQIAENGAQALSGGIPKTLVSLDLSGNALGEGVQYFINNLPPSLAALKLGPLSLSVNAFEALVTRLPAHLSVLQLKSIKSPNVNLALLMKSLPRSLTWLELVGMSPFEPIEKGGSLPTNLRWLDLSSNFIGDQGISAIAEAIPKSLVYLDLSDTQIGDQGLRSLETLPFENLKELLIANNLVTSQGVNHFIQSMSRSIWNYSLHGNPKIRDDLFQGLTSDQLKSIRALNMMSCPIGNLGMTQILKKLSRHIYYINLSSTNLVAQGLAQVIDALPEQMSILWARGLRIGELGYAQLKRSVLLQSARSGVENHLRAD